MLIAQKYNWYEDFGIPEAYANKSYTIVPDKETIVTLLKSFILGQTDYWCIFIFGDVQCGKTHLVCSILKFFVLNINRSAQFWTPHSYFHALQNLFSDQIALGNFKDAQYSRELSVMDEIGAERYTEWRKDELGFWLRERRNRRKKTIFTSNLSPTEINFDLGIDDRALARIQNSGKAIRYVKSPHIDVDKVKI